MNNNEHAQANNHNGKHRPIDIAVEDNPYFPLRRRQEEATSEDTQVTQKANPVDEADGPAIEERAKSNRNGRLKFACVLVLVLAGIGGFLYFQYGRTTKIEHQVKAKNRVSSQFEQSQGEQTTSESPEQQTLDAIKRSQEARRAGDQGQAETKPSVEPAQTIPPVPKLSIPGEYVEPRSGRASGGEAAGVNGTQANAEPSTTRNGYKTRGQPAHGSSSVYASEPAKSSVPTLPAVNPNLRPTLSTARTEKAITLPPYGEMLPVRTLGGLYTLRNSLARLQLTQDVKGDGWELRKGTVFVAQLQGGAVDRAYLSISGFIDPATNRFVKVTGDVLGSDGSPGMKGQRRQVSSRWSRVGNRVINGALSLGQAAIARGGGTTVVVGTSGLSNDVALLNTISNKEFVEVAAGAAGYVMITDLPEATKGVDADPTKYLADSESKELTDEELAELLLNGNPAQIKAAMPRMTPKMKEIAAFVIGGQEK